MPGLTPLTYIYFFNKDSFRFELPFIANPAGWNGRLATSEIDVPIGEEEEQTNEEIGHGREQRTQRYCCVCTTSKKSKSDIRTYVM